MLIEPLGSVWASSRARINNSRDFQLPPFHSKQVRRIDVSWSWQNIFIVVWKKKVVERALSSVEGLDRGSAAGGGGGYNVVTNNCEHFASWARWDVTRCTFSNITKTILPQWHNIQSLTLSLISTGILSYVSASWSESWSWSIILLTDKKLAILLVNVSCNVQNCSLHNC